MIQSKKLEALILWFLICLIMSICSVALNVHRTSMNGANMKVLYKISEKSWRKAAASHSAKIKYILSPGLTSFDHPLNTGIAKRRHYIDDWTGLDPLNPIFNFLIEYYGIKGSKGTRRLARWSPDPSIMISGGHTHDHKLPIEIIQKSQDDLIFHSAMKATNGIGGIFLENANAEDLGGTLHLRGAIPVPSIDNPDKLHGIIYNSAIFYNRHMLVETEENRLQLLKTMAPFQWYKSIMETTLNSDPIMHCHGLHEWAMQYHPEGADPPPSASYQASLKLRVSREVINKTVERKGISCTHVDALRFFAPAAAPLNHHGSSLERIDQLRLEQKACVHAHMDLLKIALKIQPFLSSELLVEVLRIAIKARKLDVEASPYDATMYGAGVVPVETKEGRKLYREQQRALMVEAEAIRIRLLQAYTTFLSISFDEDLISHSSMEKKPKEVMKKGMIFDRDDIKVMNFDGTLHATAEPGSLPWRHNIKNNNNK
jgi:hypothetical protein